MDFSCKGVSDCLDKGAGNTTNSGIIQTCCLLTAYNTTLSIFNRLDKIIIADRYISEENHSKAYNYKHLSNNFYKQ